MVQLSVLMPVHEGEKFIAEAIESILCQSFPDFELIILDNQSTDKSSKIIKEFSKKDNRIKYIYDVKKRNGNDCFSELIKFARGKYLTTVSDDNLLDKDFFLTLINLIKKDSFDWVIANGSYISGSKIFLGPFFKKNVYVHGEVNVKKILKFCFRGDVKPIVESFMTTTYLYKSFLPLMNLSRFENDADTVLSLKVLANCNIGFAEKNLFFSRIYDIHERYYDIQNIKSKYYFLEKIAHEINLLKSIFVILEKSKFSKLLVLYLKFFVPLVILFKYIKNFLIKIIIFFKLRKFFRFFI
jgi:glycosyltransferase involved in cell wall biosynthesis